MHGGLRRRCRPAALEEEAEEEEEEEEGNVFVSEKEEEGSWCCCWCPAPDATCNKFPIANAVAASVSCALPSK